jgi:rubredoxin
MKKYKCTICDYVYDPAEGDPDSGIAAGTAFEKLPDDWVCPVCGASKEDFEVIKE